MLQAGKRPFSARFSLCLKAFIDFEGGVEVTLLQELLHCVGEAKDKVVDLGAGEVDASVVEGGDVGFDHFSAVELLHRAAQVVASVDRIDDPARL